jgi:hypothetical protein
MTASMPPVAPQAKTSGLAIAALVCGIAGLCTAGLGGGVGIILGIVAVVKVKRSAGQLKGKGMAVVGIIAGILSILLWAVLIVGGLALALMDVHSSPRMVSAGSLAAVESSDENLSEPGGAFKALQAAIQSRNYRRLAELSRGGAAPLTEEAWREMLSSSTKRVPGTDIAMKDLPEALSSAEGYSGESMNDEAKYESAGATFHFTRQPGGRWYFTGFE